ncbi:metallophosphoesterase [Halorubrum sp. DTA98]|uniref:metallophosphoesterase n=1 Tax=Halorubrum sp. DTA98 TaxID=3402163 RepID=UPI003AAAD0C8
MNDVTFRDRAVFLGIRGGVLVVSDLHVGRDEAAAVSFPLGERDDLRERLSALIAHFTPETVVFAGDVIHTFDGVSDRSREGLAALATACHDAGTELELVGGNHDTALATAWNGPVHDEYVVDHGVGDGAARTVICHGHEPPETAGDRYLFGHVHPTIEIEGDRHPCFLVGEGTYRNADVVVLPAFNRLAPGVVVTDMDAAAFGSPLVSNVDDLCPFVYDADTQETLRFPPLGEFRDLL